MKKYFKGTTIHFAADNSGNVQILSGASDPEKSDIVLSIPANYLPTFEKLYDEAKVYVAQQKSLSALKQNTALPLYLRSLTDDALTELISDAVNDLDAASTKWGISTEVISKIFGI